MDNPVEGLELDRLLVNLGGLDVLQLGVRRGEATDWTSASLNGTAVPGRSSPGFSGVLTVVDLRGLAVQCAGLRRHPDVLRSFVLMHAHQP